jgi:hypothetical protein
LLAAIACSFTVSKAFQQLPSSLYINNAFEFKVSSPVLSSCMLRCASAHPVVLGSAAACAALGAAAAAGCAAAGCAASSKSFFGGDSGLFSSGFFSSPLLSTALTVTDLCKHHKPGTAAAHWSAGDRL